MPTFISSPRRTDQGYTLPELLAVVVILAAATGVIAAMGGSPSKTGNVRTAAAQVLHGLQTARSEAIARHSEQRALIDVTRNLVHVPGARDPIVLGEGLELDLIVAADAGTDRSRGSIAFFPDGSSTGGRIAISSDGDRRDVVVDWLTGQARVEDAR